jgi:Zn-dependent peptidase ImmA (M78 family)
MSAATAETVRPRGVTKVSRALGAAVKVNAMKDRVEKEAKRDAERLLKATLRLPPPIHPFDIARQLGVRALEADLDNDTLGGLFVRPEEDPRIVVNEHDGLLRCRMTCALELGYYVRLSPATQVYERADLRSIRAKASGGDPDDRYAEKFAACLLMPEEEVRILSELGFDDLELALRLRVPREAAWSRLRSLGLRVDLERAA